MGKNRHGNLGTYSSETETETTPYYYYLYLQGVVLCAVRCLTLLDV